MSDEEKARALLAARGRFPSGGDVPFDVALSVVSAALQGASSGEGDAPKGVDGCEHEWVNEACDGNHYNCQRCPATFIYDRNADEPAPPSRTGKEG